tara:strand:+ start:35105 stop:35392 length:288 start_codon:yes stop_codon:yes gene_type:complete
LKQTVRPQYWRRQQTRKTDRDNAMNVSNRMDHNDVLRVKLEVLKREHRDLDVAIEAMQQTGHLDALRLQRMKKQKLSLKDRIAVIEDEITPDIIA